MFSFIKHTLTHIYLKVTSRLTSLFHRDMDEDVLKELEVILLSADTGVTTTRFIMDHLQKKHRNGQLPGGHALKAHLKELMLSILSKPTLPSPENRVFILVGVNGSGKTTCASKLASLYNHRGKRVLLVAADTFRAAATTQLQEWADLVGVTIEQGEADADPASIVFKGCERFIKESFDILIIDTAGRLHNKTNLMNELAKIKRVIDKKMPDENINTIVTIDSMIGQSSFEQAKLFKEYTAVNAAILTKMDGTAKGGIVFAVAHELAIPIWYLTFGEQVDQFKEFDKNEYITHLLNE